MKNPYQKCYLRDKAILEQIEKFKVLNTDQIKQLCLPDIKSGDRTANRILQRLREKQKAIYSHRSYLNETAYHFIDKKYKNHPQIEHILLTNWIYIWFKNTYLTKSEIPFHFQHEYVYPTLRADGFLGIDNLARKTKIFYFIESDLSHNTFDKITKYNTLFENVDEWKDSWWTRYADGFPAIFIATCRKDYVVSKLAFENKHDLVFKVYDIDQIKGKGD